MQGFYASISLHRLSAARGRIPAWVLALVLSAMAAFLIARSRTNSDSVHPALTKVEVALASDRPEATRSWMPWRWWNVPFASDPRLVRFSLDPGRLNLIHPALILSGNFSATVWINGRYAGSKGHPGESGFNERPGPIDAVIAMTGLKNGANEIVLRISAFRAGYHPKYLFNELSLREFTPDARRSPDRYVVGLTQLGLLLVFLLFFLGFMPTHIPFRDRRWPAAMAASILLAFGVELSRSLIDYPYTWHSVRQFSIWALFTIFGLSLNLQIASRNSMRYGMAWAALALAILSALFLRSDDLRAASALAVFTVSGLIMLWRAGGTDGHGWTLAALLAPWPILALWNASAFVDNGAYVFASLILFGVSKELMNLAPGSEAANPQPIPPAPVVSFAGEQIHVASLHAVHAAGNYTELMFRDGTRRLVRAPITDLSRSAPLPLFRVHRSHLVNLNFVKKIRVAQGSRYSVELDNGDHIPVSRALVAQLRQELTACPPPGTGDSEPQSGL